MNRLLLVIGLALALFAATQSFVKADDVPAIQPNNKKIESRTDRGSALAMAFAAIPDTPNSIGLGAGRFVATNAGAIGATIAFDDDEQVLLKLMAGRSTHHGAEGSKHDKAGAIGVAYRFR